MKPEYEAMLAGIPLLPASEQQEIFDAVRSIMMQQVIGALNALQAGVGNAPVDKRVARYVKLRDARAAANKDAGNLDSAYKGALESIEKSLIATAQAQGVEGFKTEYGTTYLDTQLRASIADDNAFYNFVRETGDLDFFERRLKSTHIKEWQDNNNGMLPPGLNVFRELTMKVRRK
jgi:hypothetical protein